MGDRINILINLILGLLIWNFTYGINSSEESKVASLNPNSSSMRRDKVPIAQQIQ